MRANAVTKLGASPRSAAIGSMLTKKPISGSTSARRRPASGTPTTTFVWPLNRESSTWNAVSNTMNAVTPCARAQRVTLAIVAASSEKPSAPPMKLCTAGRGRSVGSASVAGMPARWSCHQARAGSACTEASRRRRCQAA